MHLPNARCSPSVSQLTQNQDTTCNSLGRHVPRIETATRPAKPLRVLACHPRRL
ncbi:hypothetical protein CDEST_00803 [Colletotrichum destructivum]|uniref:Uncharacterized protein n=1 Tax=Colletotrichum destructivum TaxID=34406 RepID=A0AAX4HYJ8_9PEZI|nr:hypothetical protein CDEST_00803 [Colletotrichum destructivum]